MRILGVGNACDLGDMYLRLLAGGHQVRFFAEDFVEHGTMEGMLPRTLDWRKELSWVREAGPDGVIVFEDAEHGREQEALRREGFFVVGGSAFGDRLENDRAFGQGVLADLGLPVASSRTFSDFDAAIEFIRARPRRYVFKLNGSAASSWRNYVGQTHDGRDVIALLTGQRQRLGGVLHAEASFVLMDYIDGIETGIGAYFDGERFLSPACLDWEHKHFFAGDLGELTGEMGTLVSYQDSERLFSLTLAKLAPLLRESGYVGYINLNTKINEQGIWPLEFTCRFGYPGFAILDALQPQGWSSLLRAMQRKAGSRFETLPGFAVGIVLTVPPFPYRYGYAQISRGLPIHFDPLMTPSELSQLHFGEVARVNGQLVASGIVGYLMVATGTGLSVELAQQAACDLAGKVFVPNLRYRKDIGEAFAKHGQRDLQRLGYLPRLREHKTSYAVAGTESEA